MRNIISAGTRVIWSMAERGPWGGRGGDSGKGGGDGDGSGAGPGNGGADGGDDAGGETPGGKRNPWGPPPLGPKPARSGRGPSLEDYLRRRGGGGGGGFGNLPQLGGKPWWLIIAIGLVVLWIATTSVWLVGPQQKGVVTTLGKYSRTVGSGIQLTLPAPLERMDKVDTSAIRTLQIGAAEGSQENRVLTGDQNIIDMAYEVRWSVRNPELFLFQLDDAEGTLRDVAESAMRAAVANYNLAQAIGSGRSDIENDVRRRMQQVLDTYRSGISVQGVAIRQSDPPGEVKEAFNDVNASKQRSESYRNEARAYAGRYLERARADTAAFDLVYAQYALAPEVTKRRLYYETMESVLGGVDKTIVDSNTQSYLPLNELKRRAQPAAPTGGQP